MKYINLNEKPELHSTTVLGLMMMMIGRDGAEVRFDFWSLGPICRYLLGMPMAHGDFFSYLFCRRLFLKVKYFRFDINEKTFLRRRCHVKKTLLGNHGKYLQVPQPAQSSKKRNSKSTKRQGFVVAFGVRTKEEKNHLKIKARTGAIYHISSQTREAKRRTPLPSTKKLEFN